MGDTRLKPEVTRAGRVFRPEGRDHVRSPYTGLTRKHWLDAGKYLLEGMFSHLDSIEDPMVMPRAETEVTYPHYYSSPEAQDAERRAEIFEGLTRSLFIASVVIHEEPDLVLNGIPVAEYYRRHILKSCICKEDPAYVSTYEELQEITGHADPNRCFQQTVETCALVIGLWAAKEQIWDRYSKAEQDALAAFLTSYARNNTVPQNWRLFCMLDMAFLSMTGYDIDERIMMEHAQAILAYEAGNGWYRDGQCFDYYSCWAFNFYAPLWNVWYGYEHMPAIAAQYERISNDLMQTYPHMFDRDGFTNMWGRSCIYRFAAVSAFDGNLLLKRTSVDPGEARRIASGSLLQFLTRDDFLANDIPSLGFYGQYVPLVQGYSCAESPFWLGKAFLCLHLPADHPFWTAVEQEGIWSELGQDGIHEDVLDGPALCISNHAANGETILRSGKVVKTATDLHGMWNYSKLCYNTKYPWESAPVPAAEIPDQWEQAAQGVDARALTVESQQYVMHTLWDNRVLRGNATFWCGMRDGVLYRRQFFGYNLENETHWIQAMNLADFPIPLGIVRVDKLRVFQRPVEMTLGAYGFPDNGTEVIRRRPRDPELHAEAVILKGRDHTGRARMLAMTIYDGWETLEIRHQTGCNPDSAESDVIFARMQSRHQYDATEPYVLVSQVITRDAPWEQLAGEGAERTGGEVEPSHGEVPLPDFTEEELFTIRKIEYEDPYGTGAFGNVTLTLADGSRKTVNYQGMEGCMTL